MVATGKATGIYTLRLQDKMGDREIVVDTNKLDADMAAKLFSLNLDGDGDINLTAGDWDAMNFSQMVAKDAVLGVKAGSPAFELEQAAPDPNQVGGRISGGRGGSAPIAYDDSGQPMTPVDETPAPEPGAPPLPGSQEIDPASLQGSIVLLQEGLLKDPAAIFDEAFYLALNPDAKTSGISPLEHYLTVGKPRGALGRPPQGPEVVLHKPDNAQVRVIDGTGITETVTDTKGNNDYTVAGADNNITFIGDDKVNYYHVRGKNNRVGINNLGKDDMVYLQGKRENWIPTENVSEGDGWLEFRNVVTGSVVSIATDDERDDNFVRERLNFDEQVDEPITVNITEDTANAAIVTGTGDDTVNIAAVNVDKTMILTGSGADTVNMDGTKMSNSYIGTGSDADTIVGNDVTMKNVLIDAGQGSDVVALTGSFKDVVIRGDSPPANLKGLSISPDGGDTIALSGDAQNVTIDGMGGNDTVVFNGKGTGNHVKLGEGVDLAVVGKDFTGEMTIEDPRRSQLSNKDFSLEEEDTLLLQTPDGFEWKQVEPNVYQKVNTATGQVVGTVRVVGETRFVEKVLDDQGNIFKNTRPWGAIKSDKGTHILAGYFGDGHPQGLPNWYKGQDAGNDQFVFDKSFSGRMGIDGGKKYFVNNVTLDDLLFTGNKDNPYLATVKTESDLGNLNGLDLLRQAGIQPPDEDFYAYVQIGGERAVAKFDKTGKFMNPDDGGAVITFTRIHNITGKNGGFKIQNVQPAPMKALDIITSVVTTALGFIPGVGTLIAAGINFIKGLAEGALSSNPFGFILGTIGSFAGGVASALKGAASAATAAVLRTISNVAKGLNAVVTAIKSPSLGNILGAASSIVSNISGKVGSIVSQALGIAGSIANKDFLGAGLSLLSGGVSELQAANQRADQAQQAANSLLDVPLFGDIPVVSQIQDLYPQQPYVASVNGVDPVTGKQLFPNLQDLAGPDGTLVAGSGLEAFMKDPIGSAIKAGTQLRNFAVDQGRRFVQQGNLGPAGQQLLNTYDSVQAEYDRNNGTTKQPDGSLVTRQNGVVVKRELANGTQLYPAKFNGKDATVAKLPNGGTEIYQDGRVVKQEVIEVNPQTGKPTGRIIVNNYSPTGQRTTQVQQLNSALNAAKALNDATNSLANVPQATAPKVNPVTDFLNQATHTVGQFAIGALQPVNSLADFTRDTVLDGGNYINENINKGLIPAAGNFIQAAGNLFFQTPSAQTSADFVNASNKLGAAATKVGQDGRNTIQDIGEGLGLGLVGAGSTLIDSGRGLITALGGPDYPKFTVATDFKVDTAAGKIAQFIAGIPAGIADMALNAIDAPFGGPIAAALQDPNKIVDPYAVTVGALLNGGTLVLPVTGPAGVLAGAGLAAAADKAVNNSDPKQLGNVFMQNVIGGAIGSALLDGAIKPDADVRVATAADGSARVTPLDNTPTRATLNDTPAINTTFDAFTSPDRTFASNTSNTILPMDDFGSGPSRVPTPPSNGLTRAQNADLKPTVMTEAGATIPETINLLKKFAVDNNIRLNIDRLPDFDKVLSPTEAFDMKIQVNNTLNQILGELNEVKVNQNYSFGGSKINLTWEPNRSTVGYYDTTNSRLNFNITSPEFSVGNKSYNNNSLATAQGVVLHEISHKDFFENTNVPDLDSAYRSLRGMKIATSDQQLISNYISDYANKNPQEFYAETRAYFDTHTVNLLDPIVPERIKELYYMHSGSDLRGYSDADFRAAVPGIEMNPAFTRTENQAAAQMYEIARQKGLNPDNYFTNNGKPEDWQQVLDIQQAIVKAYPDFGPFTTADFVPLPSTKPDPNVMMAVEASMIANQSIETQLADLNTQLQDPTLPGYAKASIQRQINELQATFDKNTDFINQHAPASPAQQTFSPDSQFFIDSTNPVEKNNSGAEGSNTPVNPSSINTPLINGTLKIDNSTASMADILQKNVQVQKLPYGGQGLGFTAGHDFLDHTVYDQATNMYISTGVSHIGEVEAGKRTGMQRALGKVTENVTVADLKNRPDVLAAMVQEGELTARSLATVPEIPISRLTLNDGYSAIKSTLNDTGFLHDESMVDDINALKTEMDQNNTQQAQTILDKIKENVKKQAQDANITVTNVDALQLLDDIDTLMKANPQFKPDNTIQFLKALYDPNQVNTLRVPDSMVPEILKPSPNDNFGPITGFTNLDYMDAPIEQTSPPKVVSPADAAIAAIEADNKSIQSDIAKYQQELKNPNLADPARLIIEGRIDRLQSSLDRNQSDLIVERGQQKLENFKQAANDPNIEKISVNDLKQLWLGSPIHDLDPGSGLHDSLHAMVVAVKDLPASFSHLDELELSLLQIQYKNKKETGQFMELSALKDQYEKNLADFKIRSQNFAPGSDTAALSTSMFSDEKLSAFDEINRNLVNFIQDQNGGVLPTAKQLNTLTLPKTQNIQQLELFNQMLQQPDNNPPSTIP